MNILMPTFDFSVESARFIRNEAEAFAMAGAHVRALTIHSPKESRYQKIRKGLEVFRFRYFYPESLEKLRRKGEPLYNQKSPLTIIQIPLALIIFMFQILKHARWADIIHCQWTITALLALPAKWLFKKKIVVTARGSDLRLLPKWLNRFIHRQVDAAIDCYGPQMWNLENIQNFPANYIKLPLISSTRTGSKVIPINMRAISNNYFIILLVVRFDPRKITDEGTPLYTLVDAAKILKSKNSNFHIYYIGSGDESVKLNILNLVGKYNLKQNITLLGWRNNVEDYMAHCDLGAGGTALNTVSQEFSCHKKPQLLVRGKYNKNTVWKHQINTLFFEKNNPASLAKAISFAMSDKQRLRKIGQNAFNVMSLYVANQNKGGKIYLQAFNKIVSDQQCQLLNKKTY